MSTKLKNIETLSDEDLKIVANQVLRLYATGRTDEKPLTDMIEDYIGGSLQGITSVSQIIMLECTKRWCRKED